jgi:hypothetical protein
MHPLFHAEFRGRIKAALAAADELRRIQHRGLVGQLREILVADLLRPILPHYAGFGTGKLVDCQGKESRQVDVIIYDRRLMPPLVYGVEGSIGFYPVDACLYAIEVKSKVTANELRKATATAVSIADLRYVPESSAGGIPTRRVTTVLMGLDSTSRSGSRERDRWIESQRGIRHPVLRPDGSGGRRSVAVPPLHVMCVVGRGYGFFDVERQSFGWLDADEQDREVLSCMAGISNTVLIQPEVGLPFGHYFIATD